MKCSQLEILICDYVDQNLTAGEKATVELHLAECAECRDLVSDASATMVFLEKVPAVEPPAALVNNILFEARSKAAIPRQRSGARKWFGKWLEPILQPRFAMGMAMTILSFSMLGRFAGIPTRQLKASDLEPTKIWATLEDKAQRTWDRTKKYYESLRLVYEIQSTLRDWTGSEDGTQPGAPSGSAEAPAEGPIEHKAPGPESGSPNGSSQR